MAQSEPVLITAAKSILLSWLGLGALTIIFAPFIALAWYLVRQGVCP